MRFYKPRIAWSGACGILIIALCGLWFVSYQQWNIVSYDRSRIFIALNSLRGAVQLNVANNPHRDKGIGWRSRIEPIKGRFPHFATTYGFAWSSSAASISLTVPHWLLTLASSALALVPWLPFHFSLRTLLIATTLVAVVLGSAVWAANR